MLFHFHLETRATPAQVLTAFTDFSDQRLTTWRRTLDPAKYRLVEQGDTWAVAREGSAGTAIWVQLRYEWPDSRHIHWDLLDSDHCDAGTGDIDIHGLPDGGSRLECAVDHHDPRGLRGSAILLGQRLIGPVAFPRLWRSALDAYADSHH
ncbi:hypothetical protein EKO23_00820 [Nocardioides guangzhouensis]|uniref:SRPBCC family protein n=1 Tax=Nocardioides guangzhouensis TaxID=2497878 RepID=A0A4Q4ZN68_9ACTN|nr:SRPBCC family protein [Nocardioides guangzhouensis]RYP89006.1 hypothetical protein EKO23_00820 [Nocardioides guangzhouensis]